MQKSTDGQNGHSKKIKVSNIILVNIIQNNKSISIKLLYLIFLDMTF